ncbi:universal stress protein [Natronosalvus vescus]|uniref:universal stress protein n=1 Tax=Natronosalvus vescus TaxID=2953881 RepID=UPI00209197C9|nr:universal stress protein [Natronosalvus vescus]
MTSRSDTEETILVPVANAETAARQLDTAIDIACDRSASILLLFVLDVPSQLSLADGRRYLLEDDDERMLEEAVHRVESQGVPVESRIRIARGVATGIVGAVDEHDVDTILLGWRGRPPREDIILGNHLDRVLRSAECDVLVQRIKLPRPDVDRILVPVAGGPHSAFAAETAAAIARQNDASVTLLHVHDESDSDGTVEDAEALLEETRGQVSDVASVETALVESDAVTGTITDWTTDHDVTVMGVSRGGLVQRKLLGTVSEAVGRHAAGSVILAKRYDPVPSRLRRLLP